ncbi:protein-tyrosine phosphatase-like protein [Lipomyces kononenkoae]|uniref:Protein-tyrosine phosphatase-like protein n=1 Tax=Lipomyces kononenkoae TaxID=34357 RepID=A0ACC3TBQ7_LIPKO
MASSVVDRQSHQARPHHNDHNQHLQPNQTPCERPATHQSLLSARLGIHHKLAGNLGGLPSNSFALSRTSIPQTPGPITESHSTPSFFEFNRAPPTPPCAIPSSQQSDTETEYCSSSSESPKSGHLVPSSSFSSASSNWSSNYSSVPSLSSNSLPIQSSSSSSSSSSSPKNCAVADMDAITPMCAADLGMNIASTPSKIIILDVRPYAQYAAERVRGAVNLCVPSTLLKRPAFTFSKIFDSLPAEQKNRLSKWKSAKSVIVYDGSSTTLTVSSPAFQIARKFLNEGGFDGRVYFLHGGICEFSRQLPDFVELGSTSSTVPAAAATTSSSKKCESLCLPILSGLHLPVFSKKQPPVNPFFSNIRQNMDLVGGVGEPLPIHIPDDCTPRKLSRLPLWLQDVCSDEGPKRIAERFFEIEKAEKGRLESAFSGCNIASSCPLKNPFSKREQEKQEQKFSISAALERGTKNRYNNIFPYDHTRVKLSCAPGSCDYINASFISAHGSTKRYIATQGPLPETFIDFWSVVWDQNVRVIVMLTPTSEGGQVKCHSYWQDTKYGKLVLSLVSEQEVGLSPKTNTKVRVRKFSLAQAGQPVSSAREIVHIQYVSWPDLGTPADPIDIVALSKLTGQFNSSSDEHAVEPPVVVHCSAGCGRTGTFCTVDSVIDILRHNKEYDSPTSRKTEDLVAEVVCDLRTQRLSMVQCLRQFVLCYDSVLVWKIEQLENQDKAAAVHVEDCCYPEKKDAEMTDVAS